WFKRLPLMRRASAFDMYRTVVFHPDAFRSLNPAGTRIWTRKRRIVNNLNRLAVCAFDQRNDDIPLVELQLRQSVILAKFLRCPFVEAACFGRHGSQGY